MPKSSLLLQRQRDFLRTCDSIIAKTAPGTPGRDIRTIARQALRTQAPGYYVEFEYARKVLYTYFSRGTLPAGSQSNRAMWMELIERVNARHARGWNISDALNHVLCEGRASQYFIAESTACRQLRSHRRGGIGR